VVLAARNPDTGTAAEAFINDENSPGTALFVSTDISEEASVRAMAKKAFDTCGKVDILVNNAMDMSQAAPILTSTVAQLDRQYAVAMRGAMIACQAFVPGMRPVRDSGVAVFTYIPGLVHRVRPGEQRGEMGFVAPPAMAGYPGPYPPEDCGAALAYSITRAADIHGCGIIIGQAFEQMNWPFPKPETAPTRDYERINDALLVRMAGYIGPGFPEKKLPLMTINRSEAPPGEVLPPYK
jgi:hypothetical protein